MQCVGPGVNGDENMNGAGEQVDILPPNCLVKERWKVVSVCVSGCVGVREYRCPMCLMLLQPNRTGQNGPQQMSLDQLCLDSFQNASKPFGRGPVRSISPS